MANTGALMSTVNEITKEIYQGRIREQLQTEVIGLKRIESSSNGIEDTVGGKYVTFPLRVRRNQGIGYRAENTKLQAAGQQGYASVRVGLKYGYGRVRITGQVMKLARTNPQAFANAMDKEMSGLKEDIRKDSARIFYGDGTGTVCTVVSGSEAALVVDSVQYAQIGMVVDIINNGVVAVAEAEILGINTDTNTLVLDKTYAAVADDQIVRSGNYMLEPHGLSSIVDDTNELFTLDPADEPVWKSVVNDNGGSGRALSESLMIKMVDDVRVNGGKTSLILTSLGVRRAYFELLVQQRRFTDTKTFPGGYVGLPFNSGREIPVVEDVDCPPGTQYFLDESTFTVYREEPWSWMDADGSIWKWVVDYDAWEAVLAQYWELGVDRRNANGVLRDLTEA